jgi:hypothetical protein
MVTNCALLPVPQERTTASRQRVPPRPLIHTPPSQLPEYGTTGAPRNTWAER